MYSRAAVLRSTGDAHNEPSSTPLRVARLEAATPAASPRTGNPLVMLGSACTASMAAGDDCDCDWEARDAVSALTDDAVVADAAVPLNDAGGC